MNRLPMKVKQPDGQEVIVQVDAQVYIPPQVTAQIFWLKNRKPTEWRDKKDVGLQGTAPVQINAFGSFALFP